MAAIDDLKDLLSDLEAADSAATLGDARAEERRRARAQARVALETAIKEANAAKARIDAELTARDKRWASALSQYTTDRQRASTALTNADLAPATLAALLGEIAALPEANGRTPAQLEALTTVSAYDTLTKRLLAAAEDDSGETINPADAAELRTLKGAKATLDGAKAALDAALSALADEEKRGGGMGAVGNAAINAATNALKGSEAAVARGEGLGALRGYLEGSAARAVAAGLPLPAALDGIRTPLRGAVLTALETWTAALEAYLEAKLIALDAAAEGRARTRARAEGIEAQLQDELTP